MRYVALEYKHGGDGDVIKHCIQCGGEFQPYQQWVKVWSLDRTIAAGICDSCMAHTAARAVAEPVRVDWALARA